MPPNAELKQRRPPTQGWRGGDEKPAEAKQLSLTELGLMMKKGSPEELKGPSKYTPHENYESGSVFRFPFSFSHHPSGAPGGTTWTFQNITVYRGKSAIRSSRGCIVGASQRCNLLYNRNNTCSVEDFVLKMRIRLRCYQ